MLAVLLTLYSCLDPVNCTGHSMVDTRLSRLGTTKASRRYSCQYPPAVNVDHKRSTCANHGKLGEVLFTHEKDTYLSRLRKHPSVHLIKKIRAVSKEKYQQHWFSKRATFISGAHHFTKNAQINSSSSVPRFAFAIINNGNIHFLQ